MVKSLRIKKRKKKPQPQNQQDILCPLPRKKKRNKTRVLCQYLKNDKLCGQCKHSLSVWNLPGKPTEQLTLKDITSKTNQHGFRENSFL